MPCYSPLHAYKDKSKDAQKMVLVWSRPNSWRGEPIDIPCGQCIGCRLEKARQWAVRCMHEASLYDENSFLTLTYDDQHLPKGNTLVLDDFQLFMKRLRKEVSPKRVRYFHCGEYGDINKRPHYHALLFGHDFSDKQRFSQKNKIRTYTSDALSELWTKGFCTVGEVTFESASYVARYALKKVTGIKAVEHYGDRKTEYVTMSRRPGIGAKWFEKFRGDVYPADRVIVRGFDSRPPRYYDSLLGKNDPSLLALLKIDREKKNEKFVTDINSDGKLIIESDSSGRRLLVKEEVKIASLRNLKRPLGD